MLDFENTLGFVIQSLFGRIKEVELENILWCRMMGHVILD